MKILEGQSAVVTGAGRGLGRAISLALSREGAKVGITDINHETLKETAQLIEAEGGVVLLKSGDISDMEDAKGIIQTFEEGLGGIDILVNNAGITRDNLLMRMSPDEFWAVINVNLGGVFNVTRSAIFGMMKRKRGTIINISSVSGLVGLAGQTNYSASKAGVIGFTKALSKEVAKFGITVNSIAPGFFDTDMIKTIPEKQMQKMLEMIPSGRPGNPKDIGDLVVFLASPSARYITGQVIVIDGGLAGI